MTRITVQVADRPSELVTEQLDIAARGYVNSIWVATRVRGTIACYAIVHGGVFDHPILHVRELDASRPGVVDIDVVYREVRFRVGYYDSRASAAQEICGDRPTLNHIGIGQCS